MAAIFVLASMGSSLLFFPQARDVREGADMLMVKPGMAYLDIVHQAKQNVSAVWWRYKL